MIEMLLHVLLCLLCTLISIQLQHNVYDTATRHSAATCDYRSNRAVVNARALKKHSIRDNSPSCMLHFSNDCDTVVNWYKYQAAKPAAVDLRPHGTNLQTEHESVCMHTMHCSSPKTKQLLNHRLHAQRRKPHAQPGANDAVRTTKFVTVTPSANTPTNRYYNYYCSIESAQVSLAALATSAACIWHMHDKVRSSDSSG